MLIKELPREGILFLAVGSPGRTISPALAHRGIRK